METLARVVSVHDLDAPFPDVAHLAEKGGRAGAAQLIERARTEKLTLREVAESVNQFRQSPFVGDPRTVADTIERWFDAGAFDGINLAFRTEYAADTLRGNLGLPIPANRHAREPQLVSG